VRRPRFFGPGDRQIPGLPTAPPADSGPATRPAEAADASARAIDFAGHELRLPHADPVLLDLLMILEGELGVLGVHALCQKYGYRSTRSYYVRRARFARHGLAGLVPRPPGPRGPTRRTRAVERRVVRLRVQDPDAGVDRIVALLRAEGVRISGRTVERILHEFGLTRAR
jgi:hypothetical protein